MPHDPAGSLRGKTPLYKGTPKMSSQRTHLKKGEVPLVRARERHASGQCESAGPDVPGSSVAGGCHAGISRTPHGRGPENRLRLAPGKADHQVLQRNWVRRRLRLPQRGPGLGRPQSEETPTSHTVPTIGGLGMDGIPIARKGKMSSQRTHFKKGGSIRACARRTSRATVSHGHSVWVACVRARVQQASGQCGKLGPNVAGRRRPGRVQKSMEDVTRSKRGPKLTPVSA